MLSGMDRFAHCAELLVCVAGVATDPTGVALSGSAATGYLKLRDIFRATTKEARGLAGQIATDLAGEFQNPTMHHPREAALLIPQMIAASLPDPTLIAGKNRLRVTLLMS